VSSSVQLGAEELFTGKERDSESGNDYFGARYYSSNDARFMSPDWSAKVEPVPYAKLGDPQSLNLYSYMRDNPLGGADADGHSPGAGCTSGPAVCQKAHGTTAIATLQKIKSFAQNHPLATTAIVTTASIALDVVSDGAAAAFTPEEEAIDTSLITSSAPAGESATSGEADAEASFKQKVSDAQETYPKKAGKIENHHIAPKYLGGDPNGPTVPLDGAYHQMITNAFRNEAPYGSGPVSPEELQQIMNKVYSQFPLPPGSN
jgi:RHS repeat-associated protein